MDKTLNTQTSTHSIRMGRRSEYWHLIILPMILLLALGLRLYEIGGPFSSSDDAEIAWHVSLYYPRGWQSFNILSGDVQKTTPLRLLTLSHGPLNAAVACIFVSFCSFLNLAITESVWHFPFGLLGAASVLATYALVRSVAGKSAALLAALFIAVSPFHVAYSRTSGVSHHILAYLLQSLSLFLFIRFFSGARKPRDEWAASLSLALCITTDFGFPATIVAIGCSGLICYYETKGNFAGAYRSLLKDFHRRRLVIPVLLSMELVFLEFVVPLILYGSPSGILGRAYVSQKNFGLYFGQYAKTVVFLTNPIIWVVVVPCILLSVKYFLPLDRKAIFLLWGVLYSFPLLIMGRSRLLTYYITIVGAFLIATSVILFDPPFLRKTPLTRTVGTVTGLLVAVALLMTTLSLIWRVPVPPLLAHEPDQGSVREENGAKAAGWWIRKMTPDARYVYTDAHGGAGLEQPVAWYYFHRPVLALWDASREEAFAMLDAKREQIDVLVIESDSLPALETRNYREFQLAVEIVNRDQSVLYLFVRNWPDPPTRLDATKANRLYDQEFAQLEDITDMNWFHQ